MSTEPRRIRKIVRTEPTRQYVEVPVPPLNPKRPHIQPVPGYVTLPQLAAERKIQQQLARIWVKNAGIKKPGPRWQWKEGSRELARVRKALGLDLSEYKA